MVRALGIVRLSKSPDPASTSISRQTAIIEAYAAAHGMELAGLAVDKAVSAFRIAPEKRPAIGAWLARPDDYDVVLFWIQSRIVRRTEDFMGLVSWARANGKQLISCTEGGGDITERMGELIGFIRSWQDQGESESISTRVKASQAQLAAEGRWRGGRPSYGTKAVQRKGGPGFELVPDEGGTADVIRDVVRRVIAGESANAVVADFNRHGVRAADGGPWKAHAMRKILRSRSLLLVISASEWIAVQDALAARSTRHPPTTGSNMLLGLARCGLCGSVVYRWHRPGTGDYYGRCRNELKRSEAAVPCTMRMVDYRILEAAVELDVLDDHGDMAVERRVVSPGGALKLRLDDIARELMELPARLAAGTMDRAEFMQKQDELFTEKDAMEGERITPAVPAWEPTGETVRQLWERSGADQRRAWLQRIGVVYSVVREERADGKAYRWHVRSSWLSLDDTEHLERVRRP